MNAAEIVGYAYDADLHCISCARTDYANRVIERDGAGAFQADDNGIPLDAIDREGNPVYPVFADAASVLDVCGDCCRELLG